MFSHVWSRVGSCCSHMYLNQILANYHVFSQWKGQLALLATWLGVLRVEIPNTGCHPATLAIISGDQVQHSSNVGSIQLPQLCPLHVMSLRVLSRLKRLETLAPFVWTYVNRTNALWSGTEQQSRDRLQQVVSVWFHSSIMTDSLFVIIYWQTQLVSIDNIQLQYVMHFSKLYVKQGQYCKSTAIMGPLPLILITQLYILLPVYVSARTFVPT